MPAEISLASQASGSDLSMLGNNTEGLLKYILMGPTPEFLTQQVWGGAPEFAFLACSEVILMLPGPGIKL